MNRSSSSPGLASIGLDANAGRSEPGRSDGGGVDLARARVILGDTPLVSLCADDGEGCVSLRFVRDGAVWFAFAPDASALIDRLRLGMRPSFWACPDGATPAVSGRAEVRVHGRARVDAMPTTIEAGPSARLSRRLGEQPFPLAAIVVVELRPVALAVDVMDESMRGAVPRT